MPLGPRLRVIPTTLRAANAYVVALHRHHGPARGLKFAVAVVDDAGCVHGVAMTGRPVSRMLDDGGVAEVLRLCTDGTANACSALYGAAARVAKEMGYTRIITYILDSESGASLRAAGWVYDGPAGGGSWSRFDSCARRPASDRGETEVVAHPQRPRTAPGVASGATLTPRQSRRMSPRRGPVHSAGGSRHSGGTMTPMGDATREDRAW